MNEQVTQRGQLGQLGVVGERLAEPGLVVTQLRLRDPEVGCWSRGHCCPRYGAGLETLYIEPGAPWENGYAESFNGKVRDELLSPGAPTTLRARRPAAARRWPG